MAVSSLARIDGRCKQTHPRALVFRAILFRLFYAVAVPLPCAATRLVVLKRRYATQALEGSKCGISS
jgi:hypothetical protein